MAELEFLPNEYEIVRKELIARDRIKVGKSGDLILTNMNLIYVTKGAFGGIKEIERFPLNQILMTNGKPCVSSRRNQSGQAQLDVNFRDGHESFIFTQSLTQREAHKWVNEIFIVLTGSPADSETTSAINAIPGAEFVADTLKGTVDVFKKSFGIKTSDHTNENVTKKCISCSAPLSGKRGQRVHCKYCDTDQIL